MGIKSYFVNTELRTRSQALEYSEIQTRTQAQERNNTASVGEDFLSQRSLLFSMNIVNASRTFSSTLLLYIL